MLHSYITTTTNPSKKISVSCYDTLPMTLKIYLHDDLELNQQTPKYLHHDIAVYQQTLQICCITIIWHLTNKFFKKYIFNMLWYLTNPLLKYIFMIIWHLTYKLLYIFIMIRHFTNKHFKYICITIIWT